MVNADNLKLFECLLCGVKFSKTDVWDGKFFVSTSVCTECYKEGQKQPHDVWCFGKRDVKRNGKVIHFGFSKKAIECKSECPDREICKQFVEKKKGV